MGLTDRTTRLAEAAGGWLGAILGTREDGVRPAAIL